MTEKLLQYIWQHGYFNREALSTVKGEKLEIMHPGQLNANQGPDFTGARIRIDNTLLAGSVELHLKTSGWAKHRHATDPNYNNVVLHVVLQHDDAPGTLPVLEIGPRIPLLLHARYEQLMQAPQSFACAHLAHSVHALTWSGWKDRLLAERLSRKAARVRNLLQKSNGHWEETFWWLLARGFGGSINGEAFEQVALSVPLTVLAKHKSSIHQLEALLFGQANLLTGRKQDSYAILLQKEYRFLQKKYSLRPVATPVHFLRMRPPNFPTVRLAQLAALLHHREHLFSTIVEASDLAGVRKLLTVTANDYWLYRYRFDEPSAYHPKVVGSDTIHGLVINTITPLLFAHGDHRNEEKYKEKAVQWLAETKAEVNRITALYVAAGLSNQTAADSQAFIELKSEYCDQKRCLQCAVGNALIRTQAE